MAIPIDLSDLTAAEVAAAPRTFQELVRMTSVREAILLCELYGGEEFQIPGPDTRVDRNGVTCHRSAREDGPTRAALRDVLCEESFDRLLGEAAHTRIYIPFVRSVRLIRRYRMIVEEIDEAISAGKSIGKVISRLVREHEIARSSIYRLLKRGDRCS